MDRLKTRESPITYQEYFLRAKILRAKALKVRIQSGVLGSKTIRGKKEVKNAVTNGI